jgi:hypothetical protein
VRVHVFHEEDTVKPALLLADHRFISMRWNLKSVMRATYQL